MVGETNETTGAGEFVPAFVPEEATDVAKPREFTPEEVDAEVGSSHSPYGTMGEARLAAISRLEEQARMKPDELAAFRADRAAKEPVVEPIGPPPTGEVAQAEGETPLVDRVERTVPGMPEIANPELDQFVIDNKLTTEDEAKLVAYANIVGARSKAQVAGDWNTERQKREEQKKAFDLLTVKGKDVANKYVDRYLRDIRIKEQEAEAA